MNKLLGSLGMALAVSFSGAALAGVCTKENVQGHYVVEASSHEDNYYYSGDGLYRISLNKFGKGKVTAYAESFGGELYADAVSWPIEWDVAADCTGYVFIDNGQGGVEGFFVVSGNKVTPVLNGVLADGETSGRMRAEKIRF